MICSVLIPSRGRSEQLTLVVHSFLSTSRNTEVLIRVDDDDPQLEGYRGRFGDSDRVRLVVGPRGRGYNDLHLRYEELSRLARGTWVWPVDDDVLLDGDGWDDFLAAVPTSGRVAYAEWFRLGPSDYYRPEMHFLIVPNRCWEALGWTSLPVSVDRRLHGLLEGAGWQPEYLTGVSIRHDDRPRAGEVCSVLVPSRGNPDGLRRTIDSLTSTAPYWSFEVLVRVDEDDPRLLEYNSLRWGDTDDERALPRTVRFVGPRGAGYADLAHMYAALAAEARAPWVWPMDDDAWVVGENWANQLAALEPRGRIVFPEWYFLGASGYRRTGGYFPIVPNGCWEPDPLSQAVDSYLTALRDARGWETTFLDGVTVHHDGRPRRGGPPVRDPIVSPNVRIRHPEHFAVGPHSIVDDYCYFSTRVRIGRCSHVAANCTVAGGVARQFTLGDYSSLSSGVRVWCTSDDFRHDVVTVVPPGVPNPKEHLIEGDVTLERCTAVGANSVVMPNNVIPEGTVIGALSFVPPNFPFRPWSVYAGNPLKRRGDRNRDRVLVQVEALEAYLQEDRP